MPIVQVRASQGEQSLTVPLDYRDSDAVLYEWQRDVWQSEMTEYPAGYVGDVTPPGRGWGKHNFFLSVNQSGEEANMLATSKRWTDQERAELLEHIRTLDPDSAKPLGALATINERNRQVFVASVVNPSILAIGGIVMFVGLSKLRSLRRMFPTTVIEPDA